DDREQAVRHRQEGQVMRRLYHGSRRAAWLLLLAAGAALSAGQDKPAAGPDLSREWPMCGGTPQRNMANPFAKGVPTEWVAKEQGRKNVKWVAALGSISYGGPVVAGGKVFVGTNNEKPRNPKIKGDKGVVMCFRAADGQFLWQAVHDKLETGQDNDWPQQG